MLISLPVHHHRMGHSSRRIPLGLRGPDARCSYDLLLGNHQLVLELGVGPLQLPDTVLLENVLHGQVY